MIGINQETDRTNRRDDEPTQTVFDIEHDIARLKRSGHMMAVALIVLLLVFFGVVAVSLWNYFNIQVVNDIPSVYSVVYPVKYNIPIRSEPNAGSAVLETLDVSDRLLELHRIPGYVKVRMSAATGWVESNVVKSKQDMIAEDLGLGDSSNLKVAIDLLWDQKELIVNGKLTNKGDLPVSRVRISAGFLGSDGQTIGTDETVLSGDVPLATGNDAPFILRGSNLIGVVDSVYWEILDYKVERPAP